MPFFPSSSLFQKNNARNIIYMAVLIFLKCLDLRKNVYSRTASWAMKSAIFVLLIKSALNTRSSIFNAGIILIPSFQLCRGAVRMSTSTTCISGLDAIISCKYFRAR